MWKEQYSKFMYFWAIASHVWLIVQAIKIFQDQNASGVSLPAFMILVTSAFIWLVYGAFVIEKRNPVIIASALVSMAFGVPVLIGIVLYG